MARLLRHILGINLDETTFQRRGFHQGDERARQTLELAGRIFLHGYHASLENDNPDTLVRDLSAVDREWRGFAFEGAAMGLALQDQLLPWNRRRLQTFLTGPGQPHRYMVHVGVGWVLARLHRRVEHPLAVYDPLLRWLAVDGYGFHEGYFHWPRYRAGQPPPKRLSGYARHVFDQGLGRSLWFIDGADVERIPHTITTFPSARHADLWSGVGLASAYAGGVDGDTLVALRSAAGEHVPPLAQGVAFAAQTREHAGNPAGHTELACRIMCGLSAREAAALTELALQDLASTATEPAYAVWRRRIQMLCAREAAYS